MPSRTWAARPHVSRSPRQANQSTSASLLEAQSSAVPSLSSSTSGAPTAGTSAQPKSPGSPEGRPGPLMETARHRRPGHQAQCRHHQYSPAPPGPRGPRSDSTAEGPVHQGRRDPLANPPTPGTNKQPGAQHVHGACILLGRTAWPGLFPRSGNTISQPPQRTAAEANAAPWVSWARTPVRLRPHRPSKEISGEMACGPAEPHTVMAILPDVQATPPS
ncbi:hypothetical protein NDU88_004082 [Pleurodeles waltl]|uniref:Uncharacterized protein n=1 Tax=Pleurodeles waltl TaxID=8319 RepID=A0AAV7TQ99_PLEWA|nr:hypothetical protein NDU88_004082 [Pleurodeles waltl]